MRVFDRLNVKNWDLHAMKCEQVGCILLLKELAADPKGFKENIISAIACRIAWGIIFDRVMDQRRLRKMLGNDLVTIDVAVDVDRIKKKIRKDVIKNFLEVVADMLQELSSTPEGHSIVMRLGRRYDLKKLLKKQSLSAKCSLM
jgi:hypothetical protein